ncbi:MAG: DUF6452 family protein [Bacteroidaceae bacterium]
MKFYSSLKQIGWMLFGALLISLTGCSDDGDLSQARTACKVSFYHETSQRLDTLSTLTVKAIGADSIFLQNTSASSVSLPLKYVGDSTQFEFTLRGQTPDTLTIKHKNTPHFINMDAGYAMYYELTAVTATRHSISDILLYNSTINTYEQENIRIYYPN